MKKVVISSNEENQRLDKFLKKYLKNAPLSYIYKAIRKDVKINGRRAKEDTILRLEDELCLYIDDETLAKYQRKARQDRVKRQFKVAYEDENVLIVEKPFGLLTHGDQNEKKNHLANQVIDYLIEKGDYNPRIEKTFVPAPVNRLDRNTTGLVIFGKNNMAVQTLNSMIRCKNIVNKYYLTIVKGKMRETMHLHDKMIKDTETNKIRVISLNDATGKTMETVVRPLDSSNEYSLVQVEIITGRTHQIRAHLAKAGYPVIGDRKYGNRGVNQFVEKKFGLTTQLLHAYKLTFENCTGGLEYLSGKTVIAAPPDEFLSIEKQLIGTKEIEGIIK